MINHSLFQQLPFDKLFKRLNAVTTVITPNRRLAQALKDRFDQYQADRQQIVWHTADILPFAAFLERIYLDVLYSTSQSFDFPFLLTPAQTHVLWEEIIQASVIGKELLNITQTACLAEEAWQLLHAWQLSPDLKNYFPNEDSSAFQQWAQSYEESLKKNHQADHACLSDLITASYDELVTKKPECLICYGFEILTPQQETFLGKLQDTGCVVMLVQPPVISRKQPSEGVAGIKRVCYVDGHEEIYRAAVWARTRLEANQAASVGIVVPALASCRSAILRIFNEVMHPDVEAALPQAQSSRMQNIPFNISMGLPLSAYPLVDTAFSILELMAWGLPFERAGYLLRSPFLGGGETEMNQRALLETKVRRYAEPFVTLSQLIALIRREDGGSNEDERNGVNCPILIKNLSSLISFCQQELPDKGRHAVYAQMFSHALQIMGFPGERTLDSTEYQTMKKWYEVVADFATLDRIKSATRARNAVKRLRYMASNTVFQPQTPRVPIQILGVLEAAGMVFDHVWVMDLSDEQWPLRPRPNPFLPYELQKNKRIPTGSTSEALNYSRQLKNGWLSSSAEVVLSHPKISDNADVSEIAPSKMIQSIPECELALPAYRKHRDLIIETVRLESIVDDHVPAMDKREITGGVAVIKDYAACPFRAWARHRMKVISKDEPHAGLNAIERGILAHQGLCFIWRQLKTKEALDIIPSVDFERMLKTAIDKAIQEIKRQRPFAMSERLIAIEQRRLMRLIREWLDEERKRKQFSVIATEEKRAIQIGELVLQTRLDRVDRLDNGRLIIIDYKTRPHGIKTMLGERPDEPQLPLYLVMGELPLSAAAGVAFASLKPGQMGFAAIVCEPDLLPGVKAFNELGVCAQFATWDELIAKWKQDFVHLAEGFSSGEAAVLPKDYPVTCQYCDIQPFCRIHERFRDMTEDQDDEHD